MGVKCDRQWRTFVSVISVIRFPRETVFSLKPPETPSAFLIEKLKVNMNKMSSSICTQTNKQLKRKQNKYVAAF